MFLCAVLFAPWALSRETISGLLGRWTETETGWKHLVGRAAGRVVDLIHFWETDHCAEIYKCEKAARRALYQ